MEHINRSLQNRIIQLRYAHQDKSVRPNEKTRFYLYDVFVDQMFAALYNTYGRSTAENITKVLLVITRHADKEGISYPGYRLIKKRVCIKNQNTISKTIKLMEQLKILVRIPGGGRSIPTIYKLLHHGAWIYPAKQKPDETVSKQ